VQPGKQPAGAPTVDTPMQQARTLWTRLEPRQRGLAVGLGALSFGGLIALSLWANQETWVPVSTSSDLGAIEAARASLDAQKIPYQIGNGGYSLLTREEDLGRARIASSAVGLPPGFESLSELELGATPQRERWAFQRALQGELMRTIDALEEVDASRVHLVLQERTSFLRNQPGSSASVTLRLAPGRSLSRAQVRGITALVAGAVDGLQAKDVVLVDEQGNLLSGDAGDDAAMAGLSGLLEARQALESRYAGAIEGALLPILGARDAMSVAVSVELDTTTTDRRVQAVDPNSQATVSEQVVDESQSGRRRGTGGVPGSESNLPDGTGAATGQGEDQRSLSQIASNYDYTRTEERTVRTAGEIDRVSVGVSIDAAAFAALVPAGGDAAALEESVRRTIQAAVGFDAERGDQVVLTLVPFQTPPPLEALSGPTVTRTVERLAPSAVALVGVVLFFLLVARPLTRRLFEATAPPVEQPPAEPNETEAQRLERERSTVAERLRLRVDGFRQVDSEDLNRLVALEEGASAEVLRRWIRNAS
jgi:flagellar M-ring protein FliF